MLRDQATRVCTAQYGPRPTIGLPHRVNGRFSPSGHWQLRVNGGGGGAATSGGGFSGGGRRGGMPHYVAVTPSGCYTGRAEVSGVMTRSVPCRLAAIARRHHPVGVAAAALRAAVLEIAQRHVSPALLHELLQVGGRLVPAAAFAPDQHPDAAGAQRRPGRRQAV